MIILLYGEDDFRIVEKGRRIIDEYRSKHQSGLSFNYFSGTNLDFNVFKEKIETISMFEEKRLIVLENPLDNKSFWEKASKLIKEAKIKGSQDLILLVLQKSKLREADLKRKVNMWEEFKPLRSFELKSWIKEKLRKHHLMAESLAVDKLAAFVGSDLWRMDRELGKLISYKYKEKKICGDDVDLLVASKLNLNIFQTLDALANRNKKLAFNLLYQHLKEGDNRQYLFSMIVYQLRVLLKLKSLMERGVPFNNLAQTSGLHPFVVKKSSLQLKSFNLDELKSIYRRALDLEIKVKTGQIDSNAFLDLLVLES